MNNHHPYFVLGADPHDRFFAFRMNNATWITDQYAAWNATFISESGLPYAMLPEDGSAIYLAWQPPVEDEWGFTSFGLYPELKPAVRIGESLAIEGVPISPTGWACRGADSLVALWQTDEWDTWISEALTNQMRRRNRLVCDQAGHSQAPVRVLYDEKPVGLVMPVRMGEVPVAPQLRGDR